MSARRFADDPELTSNACRTPKDCAKLALELVGIAAGGEPEIERRINQMDQLLRVEDAPAARDARPAGLEIRAVKLAA